MVIEIWIFFTEFIYRQITRLRRTRQDPSRRHNLCRYLQHCWITKIFLTLLFRLCCCDVCRWRAGKVDNAYHLTNTPMDVWSRPDGGGKRNIELFFYYFFDRSPFHSLFEILYYYNASAVCIWYIVRGVIF